MTFFDRYIRVRENKDSILCIGLDPAIKGQRDSDIIPDKYNENIFHFCIDMVDMTNESTCAYKINSQYTLFLMTLDQLIELNKEIKNNGCISILDHKLNDINESNDSAFYWSSKAGFDAITFSPFAGNIKNAVSTAHNYNLGIFVLTLMSNPESEWIQKMTHADNLYLYEKIAYESRTAKADGLVVGTTKHINKMDLKKIVSLSRDETIYLCPGIGKQKGDINKISKILGENLLINIGRAIIYDENPMEKADEFKILFNKRRG